MTSTSPPPAVDVSPEAVQKLATDLRSEDTLGRKGGHISGEIAEKIASMLLALRAALTASDDKCDEAVDDVEFYQGKYAECYEAFIRERERAEKAEAEAAELRGKLASVDELLNKVKEWEHGGSPSNFNMGDDQLLDEAVERHRAREAGKEGT